MTLSVIILNYNVRYFLEQCIKSVQRATQNIESEIIVVDNASVDDSCKMVSEKYPEVILIQNKENVGFSKANNQGVAIAKGEYVCILNPDTAVEEDVFSSCINFERLHVKVGAIGVQLIDGTGNFLPESKRNIPTPSVSLLKILGKKKRYYASKISQTGTGKVEVLVGAFMFMKREVYRSVKGFDEDYFMYGEDIDLSFKLLKAGYDNYYLGSTSVLHYKGESTYKNSEYINRFYGAMKLFYKKHFKKNVLMNVSVNSAITGVKFINKIRPKRKNKDAIVKDAIVLTESISLYKNLSESLDLDLKSSSKSIFQDTLLQDSLFIFDVRYMSYSQIFSLMKRLKNRNNYFRICPPHSQFIIGSDTSDEKGEVHVF